MTMDMIEHPVITQIERTGWPEGEEPAEDPRCPVCNRYCDIIYRDLLGDVVGCDCCLSVQEAWEAPECMHDYYD